MALVENKADTTERKLEEHEKDNRVTFEKHAAELGTANTQVALVAAALKNIESGLNELKQDFKQWMSSHTNHEG